MNVAKNVGIFAFMLVTAITIVGCGGGGGGTSSTGTVNGKVLSSLSSQSVIAGAQITINEKQVVSGNDGSFQISDLRSGTYQISVSCSDGKYKPYTSSITVQSGMAIDVTIALVPQDVSIGSISITSPTSDGPNGSYIIGNSYQFTAVVKDSNGTVIDGAVVGWSVEGGIGSIDANGSFTPSASGNGKVVASLVDGANNVSESKDIIVTESSNPDANRYYACLVRRDHIDIIDVVTLKTARVITTDGTQCNHAAVYNGKIYVSDSGKHRIQQYDIASAPTSSGNGTVQAEAQYTVYSSNGSALNTRCMTILPDGRLFLGLSDESLRILDPVTEQNQVISSGPMDFDDYSAAVYNSADGYVYVTACDVAVPQSGVYRVNVNTVSPHLENFIEGSAHPELCSHLSGIAVDSDGKILVSSRVREVVLSYSSIGSFTGNVAVTDVTHPQSLRVGPDNKLYVLSAIYSESSYGKVVRFQLPGMQPLGEFVSGDREHTYDVQIVEMTL